MYLIDFIIALVLSVLLIPVVRWLSFRLGRVSLPRADRWHRTPTPALGGVGMFVSFAAGLLAVSYFSGQWTHMRWSLLAGSALMFGLGFVDDIKRLTPPSKLIVQILAAGLVIFFGRVIHFFPWGILNILLTFFWLVGITNAINLLDNMDGLAGGIAFIAAAFLSYFFLKSGNIPLVLMSMALAGSILGFMIFNFPPAKIFMGDSGSMFLGFTLASLAVAFQPRASDVFTVMGVPVLLFLLPIIDTSLVTITRILRGQSPAQGGTDHTSHRLILFGLSERQAVLTLYAVAIVSGITGAVLETLDYELSLIMAPILLITLSLATAYLARLKVVSSVTTTPGNFARIMTDLTYKRRLLEVALDFFLIGLSFYLAFWIVKALQIDQNAISQFFRSFLIALPGAYLSFYVFGVYRGVWRYVSMDDFLMFGRATLGAVILAAIPLILLHYTGQYPAVIFFLYFIFLFLVLATSRASFRLLDRLYRQTQSRENLRGVLILGAEDAGEITLRWILRNPELGFNPIGFIDDDQLKWGRRIHGVGVLGGLDQITTILDGKRPEGIIITSPDLVANGTCEGLMSTCRERGIWVRVLRLDFELLE